MSITPDQSKTIHAEFSRLKPARVRLDGSRPLTVREAIFALAPTLERRRRRGFELAEQTEKLHDKDIELRVPTLPGISTHERFNFEKGETRGGGTAPPGPKLAEKPRFFHETTGRMV